MNCAFHLLTTAVNENMTDILIGRWNCPHLLSVVVVRIMTIKFILDEII